MRLQDWVIRRGSHFQYARNASPLLISNYLISPHHASSRPVWYHHLSSSFPLVSPHLMSSHLILLRHISRHDIWSHLVSSGNWPWNPSSHLQTTWFLRRQILRIENPTNVLACPPREVQNMLAHVPSFKYQFSWTSQSLQKHHILTYTSLSVLVVCKLSSES